MIYHHLNIACLNELDIFETPDQNVQKFLIDSTSLQILSLLLGQNKPRIPGSVHLDKLTQNPEQSIFLTARKIGFKNEIVLPKFTNCEEVKGFNFINLVQPAIERSSATRCFLGISSPKQNLIAQELQRVWPEIDYYCIGAVVDASFIKNTSLVNFFSKNRIEFLLHLFWNPKRTISKLYFMFRFIVKILFIRQFRIKIKDIIAKFSRLDLESFE